MHSCNLKIHISTLLLSDVQQMLQCQIPGTAWRAAAEWEKGSNSSGRSLFICVCVVLAVCGGDELPCLWSPNGDNAALPSPVALGGVYLLLSQVSQPGTEHLKEALTLLWIRLTWFMWAGCGFDSLLQHGFFHVSVFMGIWRWVLHARGCSLKQRYDLSLTSQNLPLDESHVAHLIPIGTWCTRTLIFVTERNLRAD